MTILLYILAAIGALIVLVVIGLFVVLALAARAMGRLEDRDPEQWTIQVLHRTRKPIPPQRAADIQDIASWRRTTR